MRLFKILLLISISYFFVKCESGKTDQSATELAQYFSVNKTISKSGTISVGLSGGAYFQEAADGDMFSISPKLDGSWVKISSSEFVFSPSNYFESGRKYKLTVDLTKIDNLPNVGKSAVFEFEVLAQNFDIATFDLTSEASTQGKTMAIEGLIETADVASLDDIKKMLVKNGAPFEIFWRPESNTKFYFTITGISRKEEAYDIALEWSGQLLGIDKTLTSDIRVPSIKDFDLLSARAIQGANNYISLKFSDIINANQELEGIIELESDNSPRFVIEGNEVKVFPSVEVNGSKRITINPDIQNINGFPLGTIAESTISFEETKPEIKFLSQGTIIPATTGLYLPFEAVGLRSVHVKVIKIFTDNLPIFFQSNEYGTGYSTKRVGRPVYQGKMLLVDKGISLGNWNRHHLDLTKLFEAEKGAMYRVEISMKPDDALVSCGNITSESTDADINADWSIYKADGLSAYDDYYSYYYPDGFDWDNRNNPCDISYYYSERTVSTNLLATDIAIISKIGADNSINIITTSISNAKPISAQIKVLDFQLQEVAKGKTNDQGFISVSSPNRPFLIVAEANGQKSYLKLADGLALSTSNFDVAGGRVNKGIKGFVYGERDVWRPGDDIFLTLMIDDPARSIPAGHPITFELRDPEGQLVDRQINSLGKNGVYSFKTATKTNSITGNWIATFSLGNNQFSKSLKIETIKPNRLKINMDFDEEAIYTSSGGLRGKLSANWLTGLQAPTLKAQVTMTMRPAKTTFNGLANFSFDGSNSDFYEEPTEVLDSKTGEDGAVALNIPSLNVQNAQGKLRVKLESKVYEPGGGFSIFTKYLDYYPYTSFAGVRCPDPNEYGYLNRNQNHTFEVVSVSDKGSPKSTQLQVDVYKLSWRWWWDQQNDYNSNYISDREQATVFSKRISTTNGKGSFQLDGAKLEWGRHKVVVTDPTSGHSAEQVFYMGWGDGETPSLGASFLAVTADKQQYIVGEKASFNLPASVEGNALITIENGSKVLDQFWIATARGTTSFSVPITDQMAPNVYVNVTMLQPHAAVGNDLPIRTYGILPLMVSNPNFILTPELKVASSLKPNEEVKISISEKDGKPMTYTIAMVDEGLLDITGNKTPDPWNYFNQKEALGVKTWDLYDDVLGAYAGKLERLLAIGGSDDLDMSKSKKRDNRFKSVVKFIGPFELKAGKKADHSLQMPQYIGSVRFMVVAAGEGKYGSTEKAVPVTQPLMVLGTLPRVLGPSETLSIPVNVMKLEASINQADVTVRVEGSVSLVGNAKQKLALKGETTTAYFDLKANDKPGPAKIIITAQTGSDKAEHIINIETRLSNPEATTVMVKKVAKGEKFTQDLNPVGVAGTNSAVLAISQLPSFKIDARLNYLIQYPHGCVEQTVSAAFPQLFLSDIMNLPTARKVKIEQHIKEAISRLQSFQTYDGGFSYWPGNSEVSLWGTNYAHHFLIEAQKKGYSIPKEMLKKVNNFQSTQATSWSKAASNYNDALTQAYRLYVLAASGNTNLSAMNKLRTMQGMSYATNERLAAAYAVIGRSETAITLIKSNPSNSSLKSSDYEYNYGSEERDMAMRLELYSILGDNKNGFPLYVDLASRMASNTWFSTQTTAYALLAASKFVATQEKSSGINANVNFGGKSSDWITALPMQSESLMVTDKLEKLAIENKGQGDIYITITSMGIPKENDGVATAQGLDLQMNYFDQKQQPVDINNIPIGTSFTAITTLKNTSAQTLRNIALTQIFASGWEINNDRIAAENQSSTVGFSYVDVRDDRVYHYLDLKPGQSVEVSTSLTAAYAGDFYLPAVSAEAMYDATKNALVKGKWVKVVGVD